MFQWTFRTSRLTYYVHIWKSPPNIAQPACSEQLSEKLRINYLKYYVTYVLGTVLLASLWYNFGVHERMVNLGLRCTLPQVDAITGSDKKFPPLTHSMSCIYQGQTGRKPRYMGSSNDWGYWLFVNRKYYSDFCSKSVMVRIILNNCV